LFARGRSRKTGVDILEREGVCAPSKEASSSLSGGIARREKKKKERREIYYSGEKKRDSAPATKHKKASTCEKRRKRALAVDKLIFTRDREAVGGREKEGILRLNHAERSVC